MSKLALPTHSVDSNVDQAVVKQLKKANPARAGGAKQEVSHSRDGSAASAHHGRCVLNMQRLFNRRSLGLGLAIAASAAVPAQAQAATVDTSMCSAGTFSQPFLALRDSNWYTLAPGMEVDNVTGTGWELSGGAKLTITTLADGKRGSVIDLPSGSKAVSPTMCVTSEYPKARTYIRDVKGNEGVGFFVSYEGTKTWEAAKNTGLLRGTCTLWSASDPVNLQPSSNPGWQRMRITLIPGGRTSDFQIYNLYLDPRMSH